MVEEFHKYTKIRPVGYEETKELLSNPHDLIHIEEKIDGGNFRFTVINGKIIFGTRTQQITSDDGEDANVGKMFRKCVDFIREKVTPKLTEFDLEGKIFYGECCVRHTMAYDWDKIPIFLGFDIYDLKTQKFLDYVTKTTLFTQLELETVPVIDIVSAEDIKEINDDLVPESYYAHPDSTDKKAEGIVLKNYDKQIFAKYVRNAFKEKNAEAFGGTPKYNKESNNNNAELVHKYVTNARIEKIVFKLLEEDNPLEMSLMHQLPRRVWQDIIEEEATEICNSKWTIDFKKISKLIAKRCFAVLQQIITNNALNGDEE